MKYKDKTAREKTDGVHLETDREGEGGEGGWKKTEGEQKAKNTETENRYLEYRARNTPGDRVNKQGNR